MIRSVEVIHRDRGEAWPHASAAALIAIATPGNAFAARPSGLALSLSFDTLAGELEAASLRVPQAAPAVPFTIDHALTLATFLSALQRDREPIDLLIRESEGYVRSVTIGRWAARRLGCPLYEPATAAALISCALMDSVLKQLPRPAREVARQIPQACAWAVQP